MGLTQTRLSLHYDDEYEIKVNKDKVTNWQERFREKMRYVTYEDKEGNPDIAWLGEKIVRGDWM